MTKDFEDFGIFIRKRDQNKSSVEKNRNFAGILPKNPASAVREQKEIPDNTKEARQFIHARHGSTANGLIACWDETVHIILITQTMLEKSAEVRPSDYVSGSRPGSSSSEFSMICSRMPRCWFFHADQSAIKTFGVSDKYFCRHCEKGRTLFEQWKKRTRAAEYFRAWNKRKRRDRNGPVSGVDGMFENIRLEWYQKADRLLHDHVPNSNTRTGIKSNLAVDITFGEMSEQEKHSIASALAKWTHCENKARWSSVFIRMCRSNQRDQKHSILRQKMKIKSSLIAWKDVELLVIDDLGVEKVSECDWWNVQIIDFRWNNKMHPWIITSNRSLDDRQRSSSNTLANQRVLQTIHFKSSDEQQSSPTLF